ncbi:MAG: signal peptidase I, partial [Acholeplasmatales bacterium]|nr:signal peptidase I [Acholeplasmatales bacterium]
SIINMNVYIIMGFFFSFTSLLFLIYSVFALITKKFEDYNYKVFSIHDLVNFAQLVIYIIFFVLAFILTPTTVSGSSMNATLFDEDKLLIWHMDYVPERDDIVVIDINENYKYKNELEKYPNNAVPEEFYIKRIVATSGDVLKYEGNSFEGLIGDVYLNDSETPVATRVTITQFKKMGTAIFLDECFMENNTIVVPDGCSVVLGDNRGNSIDSRYIGLIKNSDILGKAVFRYFSKNANFGKITKSIQEIKE